MAYSEIHHMKKLMVSIAKFGVVVAIFAILYQSDKLDTSLLKSIFENPSIIILPTFLVLISVVVASERWRALLRAQNIFIGALPAFMLSMVGMFFSMAPLGAVSGDIAKSYYLVHGKKEKVALVASVLFDRLLGLYTIVLLAAVTGTVMIFFVMTQGEPPFWWGGTVKALLAVTLGIFIVFTAGMGVFMSGKLSKTKLNVWVLTKLPFHDTVVSVYNAVHRFGHKPIDVVYAIFLSVLSQLNVYLAIWVLAVALKIDEISLIEYIFVIPVCTLINALPIVPGGIGIGEVGFGEIFAIYGSDNGVELAMLFHVATFIVGLGIGGFTYLLYRK